MIRPIVVTYCPPDDEGRGGYLRNEDGDIEAQGFASRADAERWVSGCRTPAPMVLVPTWTWGADDFPTRNAMLDAGAMLLQDRLAENDPPLGTVTAPDGRQYRVVVSLNLYPVRLP